MRKIIPLALLAAVLLIFSGCENGFNLTGGSHDARNVLSATLDPVAGCAVEQVHQHNGDYYSGHYNNDSHGHHGLQADNICVISTCEITALHSHNGVPYAGHHNSDGHGGNGNQGNNGHHG